MIEEWLPNSTVIECKNMSIAAHNEMLYDEKVKPYLKVRDRRLISVLHSVT